MNHMDLQTFRFRYRSRRPRWAWLWPLSGNSGHKKFVPPQETVVILCISSAVTYFTFASVMVLNNELFRLIIARQLAQEFIALHAIFIEQEAYIAESKIERCSYGRYRGADRP